MAVSRVLIVDDEPVLLRAVSKMLSKYGYDVRQANGPRQALEIINGQGPIEVVLSDVLMSEMSGMDLLREVARISPQTSCILMTGGIVDSAEIPEIVHVLHKPFPMPELIAAVVEAVARCTNMRTELEKVTRQVVEQYAEQAGLPEIATYGGLGPPPAKRQTSRQTLSRPSPTPATRD